MKTVLGKSFRASVVLGLALGIAACGSTTGPTPPTPAGPSKANVVATFSNAVLDFSPRAGFNYRLSFDLTLRETAGVGVKLNFIRADFRDTAGSFIERQEAGSNNLNRIQANGTLQDPVNVDFNDGRSVGAVITINGTDDRGNVIEIQQTILF